MIDKALDLLEPFLVAWEPERADPDERIFEGREAMRHARWMLEELRTNPKLACDDAKANRWLGSVFGIVIGAGYMTINDAREIVTKAGE